LNDPVYVEEQQRKAEEEKRLAQEAKLKGHETPGTWEHYRAPCEEADRRAREADAGGTTSETWPLSQLPPGNFPFVIFMKSYNSL
jgi:hypothetical protein